VKKLFTKKHWEKKQICYYGIHKQNGARELSLNSNVIDETILMKTMGDSPVGFKKYRWEFAYSKQLFRNDECVVAVSNEREEQELSQSFKIESSLLQDEFAEEGTVSISVPATGRKS